MEMRLTKIVGCYKYMDVIFHWVYVVPHYEVTLKMR